MQNELNSLKEENKRLCDKNITLKQRVKRLQRFVDEWHQYIGIIVPCVDIEPPILETPIRFIYRLAGTTTESQSISLPANLSFEQIIEHLSEKIHISKIEIQSKIEDIRKSFDGLLSNEGALAIFLKESQIDFTP